MADRIPSAFEKRKIREDVQRWANSSSNQCRAYSKQADITDIFGQCVDQTLVDSALTALDALAKASAPIIAPPVPAPVKAAQLPK